MPSLALARAAPRAPGRKRGVREVGRDASSRMGQPRHPARRESSPRGAGREISLHRARVVTRPPPLEAAVQGIGARAVGAVDEELLGPDYGFARGFADAFELGELIGRGGYGRVYRATATGGIKEGDESEFIPVAEGTDVAVKVIPKLPATLLKHVKAGRRVGQASYGAEKQLAIKAENLRVDVKREVRVLRKLRGTPEVAHMYGVYEDDLHVYIVLELCTGGEVLDRLAMISYTEAEVARIMRAVFRTLAKCHENSILHLDVKPSNFLFHDDAPDACVRTIDFGLATFYTPEQKEGMPTAGTAWFMAPELLRSEVGPAADVWAAGVMLFQLLSGRFPFNDHHNPLHPSMNLVWRSILEDDLDPQLMREPWPEISEEAICLVRKLLHKDPTMRPTAVEALRHPWLRPEGRPGLGRRTRVLDGSVAQRLQQFAAKDTLDGPSKHPEDGALLLRHTPRA